MNILQAMDDPAAFGQHFRNAESWQAWRSFLASVFALPMSPEEIERYQVCTGREHAPSKSATEGWLICGRRAGKSFILAVVAVFLAVFRDWRPHLGPGERATIMVIAADRRQARVIMRYVLGLLRAVPMLEHLIESERSEAVDLSNRVTIEVHTASFRTTRGYSVCAALCDEIAFWSIDESAAEPDTEILSALRPAMATVPGAILYAPARLMQSEARSTKHSNAIGAKKPVRFWSGGPLPA
jgi:Terminase large subunit, T4likevirus-type, N-terminal